MNELALFAGAGGGILGGHMLGWRTICAVEWEPYPASVLCARQNDGILPPFPVWDDVQTFDGRPWRGIAQVVSGGFPCTDISAAGKGAGIEGEASGMWRHMARIVGEVLPRFVFVENSPLLVGRGAAMVIGDLAALGYDAQWACISASDTGAPHKRDRFWLVANANVPGQHSISRPIYSQDGNDAIRNGRPAWRHDNSEHDRHQFGAADQYAEKMANGHSLSAQRMGAESQPRKYGRPAGLHSGARIFPAWPADPADAPESGVGRVVNGLAARVDRLKAIGNGQVPRVAATAFTLLSSD